jgi:hypothetical protein
MKAPFHIVPKTLVLAALVTIPALSSAQTAADLGKSLTPVGAEAKANADGSIPPWTGGDKDLLKAAVNPTYPNPYAAEKPIAKITAANLATYQSKLAAGHVALLKKYPTFALALYKTHRSALFPQAVYDETALNPGRAKLVNGGITGTTGGVPFPIPKSGEEAILNHKFRFIGSNYSQYMTKATVSPAGDISTQRINFEFLAQYGNPDIKPADRVPNILSYYMERKLAPARVAGEVTLAQSALTETSGNAFQSIWLYNPGQRRVRLAPEFAYDNPQDDGLRTSDEVDEFNGGTDRYDWKLVGKKELIVPYNNYQMMAPTVKMTDLLKPNHMNPDLLRYELHRVWVVEATLKKGASHIYGKRVFYVDEDSWSVLIQDKYDTRGELWRVSESAPVIAPWLGTVYTGTDMYYDLRSGRYLVGLTNQESPNMTVQKHTPDFFSAQNLRNLGTR